ncbi:hypothetical protein TraAM80_05360 [Trypanosoma rangeli]|uniref:Uncharacterized protein n=1 Tax=Trypanosoma rangeli TaxID=5698 RepID=A0A3R7KD60_TRYRA|nr:uncharacterized protein TraAM80_05360 [Trypanosoma rangeli]RNF04125.1 hypothetical protein TraAM80_05360 [Trypanosoma rangeli]|eukprot:RNF04125.1 hypothetical protein TraAM80_05360 [Trypanosoma rangeli]
MTAVHGGGKRVGRREGCMRAVVSTVRTVRRRWCQMRVRVGLIRVYAVRGAGVPASVGAGSSSPATRSMSHRGVVIDVLPGCVLLFTFSPPLCARSLTCRAPLVVGVAKVLQSKDAEETTASTQT